MMSHEADPIFNWIILRPSVVIRRVAYGASAMLRGLAALPILPLMPDMRQPPVCLRPKKVDCGFWG
jgi:hypothetical protein